MRRPSSAGRRHLPLPRTPSALPQDGSPRDTRRARLNTNSSPRTFTPTRMRIQRVARLIAALGRCPIATNTQTQRRPNYAAAGSPGRPTLSVGAARHSTQVIAVAHPRPNGHPRSVPGQVRVRAPAEVRADRSWIGERVSPRRVIVERTTRVPSRHLPAHGAQPVSPTGTFWTRRCEWRRARSGSRARRGPDRHQHADPTTTHLRRHRSSRPTDARHRCRRDSTQVTSIVRLQSTGDAADRPEVVA
jgi:hypothetical protein